jgi:hypothetical protein
MTTKTDDAAPKIHANGAMTANIVDLMWDRRNLFLIQLIQDMCTSEQIENIRNLFERWDTNAFPLMTTPDCVCGRHPLTTSPYTQLTNAKANKGQAAGYTLAAIPRSGSSMVHETLNRLLTQPVVKTHRLFRDQCPMINFQGTIFFTVRHPYDAAYSLMRYKLGGEKISKAEIDEMFEDVPLLDAYIRIFNNSILRSRFLAHLSNTFYFIRYEDYWSNEEKLVEELYEFLRKSHFGNIPQIPELSSDELHRLAHETSASSRIIRLSAGKTGPHIGPLKGRPDQGKFLEQETKDYIAEKYGSYFKTLWGYSL